MIIHASIPADDQSGSHASSLRFGAASAFPSSFPKPLSSWLGTNRGMIEVAPRGKEIFPAETIMSFRINASPSPHNDVNLNIATPLSLEEALAIAKREGCTARVCDRGPVSKVIEFWLENKCML